MAKKTVGYQIPDNYATSPPAMVAFCVPAVLVKTLCDHVEKLWHWYSWEHRRLGRAETTETPPAALIADFLRQNYPFTDNHMRCDDAFISNVNILIQNNITAEITNIENNYDGTNGSVAPTYDGLSTADQNTVICLALHEVIQIVLATEEQRRDENIEFEHNTVANIILGAIAGLSVLATPPVAAIFGMAFSAAFTQTIGAKLRDMSDDELQDGDAQSLAACTAYSNLTLPLTHTGLRSAFNNPTGDVTADKIADIMYDAFENITTYLAFLKLLDDYADTIERFPNAITCPCDTGITIKWLSDAVGGTHRVFSDDWQLIDYGGVIATYDAVQDRVHGACNSWPSITIRAKILGSTLIALGLTNLTTIEASVNYKATRIGSSRYGFYIDGVNVMTAALQSTTPHTEYRRYDTDIPINPGTEIEIRAAVPVNSCASSGYSVMIAIALTGY
jgi:hypothetical protein